MVNPRTVNLGIIVPLTGADVDTWGEDDVNPNMISFDGFIGGIQTIGLTNVPVTLTSPAGFAATPSPGPTQSENRVLRFTGVLTGNVRVMLPLPGSYLIDNRTTGNFVLSIQGVTATEVVGIEQGSIVEIYNDGANVRFINLGRVGELVFLGGETTLPAWISACTVKPFLTADGTVYNIADYPWLGAKYLAKFGGNGATTFGVQDLRGRVPLMIDSTGTRITVAQCGIDGNSIGAAGGNQSIGLVEAHNGPHFHSAGMFDPAHLHGFSVNGVLVGPGVIVGGGGSFFGPGAFNSSTAGAVTGVRVNSSNGLDTTYSSGSGTPHINVQPAQVCGIWVVKT